MKKNYYKQESSNIRFCEFINLLADSDENGMSLFEMWEKVKSLYYFSVPGSSQQMINMTAMKKDVNMARKHGYLIMTGNRSTTKYVKTDLLLKPSTSK